MTNMIQEYRKLFDELVAEDRYNVSCHISTTESAGVPTTMVSLDFSYPKFHAAEDVEYAEEDVDTGEDDFIECTGDFDTGALKDAIRDAVKSFGGDASETGADVKVNEIPGGVCVSFRKVEEDPEPEPKCCEKKCCCKKSDKFADNFKKLFKTSCDPNRINEASLDKAVKEMVKDIYRRCDEDAHIGDIFRSIYGI